MSQINIAQTTHTPEVFLDSDNGVFCIKGKSFPENTENFYTPLIEAIETFDLNSVDKFECKIAIDYLSSSSTISLLKVIKAFVKKIGKDRIHIIWEHEEADEDLRKIGEDFSSILDISFEFVTTED